MRTPHAITLQCPLCATWFLSTALDGPESGARTTTDFHRCVEGHEPVAYLVDLCTACGFAGPREDFASDDVGGASAVAVGREIEPAREGVAASEKYETAAAVAERRGEGDGAVAELLLRAAWCCIVEEDSEAERFFRRRAARSYERALAQYDDVPRARRAELTYLVGELWRRAGDVPRARAWFDRVGDEVVDEPQQRWLVTLAAQQRDRPCEWLADDRRRAA